MNTLYNNNLINFFAIYFVFCALLFSACSDSKDSNKEILPTDEKNIPDDLIAPRVLSVFPSDYSTGIDENTNIVIEFDEEMDIDSLGISEIATTNSPFTLQDIYGTVVGVTVSLEENNKFVQLNPSSVLLYETEYLVNISTDVKDINGNELIEEYNWRFTTRINEADYPEYPSGETILQQSEGTIFYNYWSYVPKSLKKSEHAYFLLDISHPQLEDYNELTAQAKGNCNQYSNIAEEKKYIILTPVIPRNFTKGYYPQGINEYSLKSSTPDFYYRPDLKVNKIIENFRSRLEDAGYSIYDKIFVCGFSAGGMWANRYSVLHPDKVKAVAIGQAGGWLTIPNNSYDGRLFNWPLGINNFPLLTGEDYNKFNLLTNVPMFIFIGDKDVSNTYTSNYPNSEDIAIWGSSDPERLENQYQFLKTQDYNVLFKLYPNVGHYYSSQMKKDVINFLHSYE